MADNTLMANPLIPKPEGFVGIGSKQGQQNKITLAGDQASLTAEKDEAGIAVQTLDAERGKLATTQTKLQEKTSEKNRVTGEKSTAESELNSARASLSSLQGQAAQAESQRQQAVADAARAKEEAARVPAPVAVAPIAAPPVSTPGLVNNGGAPVATSSAAPTAYAMGSVASPSVTGTNAGMWAPTTPSGVLVSSVPLPKEAFKFNSPGGSIVSTVQAAPLMKAAPVVAPPVAPVAYTPTKARKSDN